MTIDGAGNTLSKGKKFNITSTPQIFTDWVGSTGQTENWSNTNSFEDFDAFVAKYDYPV